MKFNIDQITMFLLVLWILEGTYSIVRYSNVVKPRREFEDYGIDEEVEAKFLGKTYPAKIVRKGANKKELEKEMDMVITGFNSAVLSMSDKGENSVGKSSAEREKKKKIAEAQKENREKKEAVKKQKQKLITDLDNELRDLSFMPTKIVPISPRRSPRKTFSAEVVPVASSTPRRSPRKRLIAETERSPVSVTRYAQLTPVSPSIFRQQSHVLSSSENESTPTSSPASTVSHSLLDIQTQKSKDGTLARTLYFSDIPLNSKGYPTVAAKQPRQKCDSCSVLRKENQALRKEIEELKESLKSKSDKSLRDCHEYARPAAGIHDADFASKNGMEELFPATGVYLHKDQLTVAINKSTTSQKLGRDGKRVARYLLTVFFTNNQLQMSSLTKSEASKYPPLNQQIIEAVIAFSIYNSDTKRGEILRAMRSSLTSKRCKAKKTQAV